MKPLSPVGGDTSEKIMLLPRGGAGLPGLRPNQKKTLLPLCRRPGVPATRFAWRGGDPRAAQRSALLRLQIPQQPIKCLLIQIMVLPITKIPNVPRPPYVRRPGLIRIHHCIIQPDRKQNGPLLLALFFERSFNLFLNPRAFDRML